MLWFWKNAALLVAITSLFFIPILLLNLWGLSSGSHLIYGILIIIDFIYLNLESIFIAIVVRKKRLEKNPDTDSKKDDWHFLINFACFVEKKAIDALPNWQKCMYQQHRNCENPSLKIFTDVYLLTFYQFFCRHIDLYSKESLMKP